MPAGAVREGTTHISTDGRGLVSFRALTLSVKAEAEVGILSVYLCVEGIAFWVLVDGDVKER